MFAYISKMYKINQVITKSYLKNQDLLLMTFIKN